MSASATPAFCVLDIPSLELPPGFYEVRGPNGSGKTTLLKAIAGLLPLSRPGAIALDGLDAIRDRVAYRRVCGFAEAEPLYPEFLTGAELYTFYVKAKGGEGPYAPAPRGPWPAGATGGWPPRAFGGRSALWPLRALWARHRGLLVIVQLFSVGILCVARPGDDLFDLFFPFILGATALPLFYAVRFLERELAFMRNMPIATGGIGVRLLLIQAILFLPEGIILRNPLWYALGLAQGMLYIGLLYTVEATMGRFMRTTLITVFGTTCLMRWSPVGAALIEGGVGAALFFNYYVTATYSSATP